MTGWSLTTAELRDWLAGLLGEGRRIIAPVQRDRLRIFRPIVSADEVCLAPGQTRWSAKEYLFPRTEAVFSYTVRGAEVTIEGARAGGEPQVLFGVRACDAAGFCRLDAVFLDGPADPLYAGRRGRSVVVTLACADAEPECFCAAVGGHPAGEEGADAQLLPAGDGWILRALTSSGEALTASLAGRPTT